jgi:6-pyruvoyltetrahydropterin/6-carboxytetrahydropterin synthase
MREIRFSIDRDWARAAHGEDGFAQALPVTNSFGGWPSAVGIAPYLVLRIIVSGQPDPVTGYLVNIADLDHLLRQQAIPLAARRLSIEGVRLTGERLAAELWGHIAPLVPSPCHLGALALWTTPYLSYALVAEAPTMVEVTQCFEFSASHRLHVPDLSPAENRHVFGKCNHLHGHGHNYRLEVTVAGPLAEQTGQVIALPQFEDVVRREVIERFDHVHLNADLPEFARLNPSVENIARTIWGLLHGKLSPATLRRVRVWETAKTYAEYQGE